MLTPQQIIEIRNKAGLSPIQVKGTTENYVGKYDYLKPADKKESIFDKISNAFSKRVSSVKNTIVDTAKGDINPAETGIQTVGQAAGLVGDIMGIGLDEVMSEPIKQKITEVATKIMENDTAKEVMSAYAGFKQKYPEAAKDLESGVNILALLPIGKAGQVAGKGVKAGAEAVETGIKEAAPIVGKTLERAAEIPYKAAIPLSKQEARVVQTYKANNPLLKRVFEPLESQPRTAAKTAIEKGFAGTEEMIGVQAKKEALNLWNNKIAPAVASVKEKYNLKEALNRVEKNILNEAELGRRNELKEALQALKEDYKNVPQVTYKKAQSIKSGLDKFTPDRVFNGKPIGSAYKEVKKMLADDIRQSTYKVLDDVNIKTDYLDYGNLKGLSEYGINAMTSGARKAGFGSFVSNLWDRATTPVFTGTGKVLKTIGKSLNR